MNKPPIDDSMTDLWAANTPAAFWHLLNESVGDDHWRTAVRAAAGCLGDLPAAAAAGAGDLPRLASAVLGEGQFGPGHWTLSPTRRLYYRLRPFLPAAVRPLLRRLTQRSMQHAAALGWPIEDRYVQFQQEVLRQVMRAGALRSARRVGFWPDGRQYALVLTHDVESAAGQAFVRTLADLEAGLGFRSSFNFVPEAYAVDTRLLAELRDRGFEVGVHGLKHDGRLYESEPVFKARAARINGYIKQWGASGFRSPLTHRHPAWMQGLNIEYDSSFFDTDPLETIPGGTMSLWPFMLGHFVELPYTLPQDHVILTTLKERAPTTWLRKLDFIRAAHGMALLNAHPDYLRPPEHLAVYREFLSVARSRGGYWHALPREVARWWRSRMASQPECREGDCEVMDLPGASVEWIEAPRPDNEYAKRPESR